jgi:transposase
MTPSSTNDSSLSDQDRVTLLLVDNAKQAEQVKQLTIENQRLTIENKLLREKVDLLVRKLFGTSSEALSHAQLELLLQGADGAKPVPSVEDVSALEDEIKRNDKASKKVPNSDKERPVRIPDNLPVSETLIILPDEVKNAPEAYRYVNDEVTEQLDYVPASFAKRVIVRKKFAKIDEPHLAPIIAEVPTLFDRSKAAPGLLAHILVSKYCDHLPLYRQEQIFSQRFGIDLPRQTLCRWTSNCATSLLPIYNAICGEVFQPGALQGDETLIKYLQPGSGRAQHGYFWTFTRPGGDTVYAWSTSRDGKTLQKIIPSTFSGTLGCDGYIVYPNFAQLSDGRIKLSACWAHVRRKFDEAKQSSPKSALIVLKQIQNLYLIERRLRKLGASAKIRQVARNHASRPIIVRLGKLLTKWQEDQKHLPQSLMGKAISYTQNIWNELQTYLDDGRAEIDNNLVENAIRPTAVGKKNWLFIGDSEAGDTSAIIYTIIEACRRVGMDPYTYLRDLFTQLPTMNTSQIKALPPAALSRSKKNRPGDPRASAPPSAQGVESKDKQPPTTVKTAA